MTPTLEQIARETATKILKDHTPWSGEWTEACASLGAAAVHGQIFETVLAALQTAAKQQPQGADWAEAAAKEITDLVEIVDDWNPEFAAIIRKHAPLVANREDSPDDYAKAILAIGMFDLQYHSLRSSAMQVLTTRRPFSSAQSAVLTDSLDELAKWVEKESPKWPQKDAAMRPAQPERGQGEGTT